MVFRGLNRLSKRCKMDFSGLKQTLQVVQSQIQRSEMDFARLQSPIQTSIAFYMFFKVPESLLYGHLQRMAHLFCVGFQVIGPRFIRVEAVFAPARTPVIGEGVAGTVGTDS